MLTSDELLREPLLKLKRAHDHINDLERQLSGYAAEKPMRLLVRQEPKLGKRSLIIKAEKPVPEAVPFISGDAVHNLRAALDMTMFAVTNQHTEKPEKIIVPFARKPESLGGAIKEGQVKAAGERVVELIETLKPYPGGDELLCGLHDLDRRDKHRLILAVARFPKFSPMELHAIDRSMGSARVVTNDRIILMPHGDVLYTWDMPKAGTPGRKPRFFEKETEVQPTVVVCFGEGQPFCGDLIVPKLVEIAKHVEKVMRDIVGAYLHPDNVPA